MSPGSLETNAMVRSQDCAVCVGIPLDEAAFQYSAAHGRPHAFVPGMSRAYSLFPEVLEQIWAYYFENVADPVTAACEKFECLGASVYRTPVWADLREIAKSKAVVVLLTHWRSPEFHAADVVDAEGLLAAASAGTHWVHREVDGAVRPSGWWPWRRDVAAAAHEARERGQLADFVADALNDLVARARTARSDAGARATPETPAFNVGAKAPLATRILIEHYFPEYVRAGDPMEFDRGMARAVDLLDALPTDRTLVVDFHMCNANEFQEVARLTRPQVRVIAPDQATDVTTAVLLINETLKVLRERPMRYDAARALAVRRLDEELRGL